MTIMNKLAGPIPVTNDIVAKHILIGVCGGIAAYKVAYLIRELRAHKASVRVVMTQAAHAFVGSMTLQALSGEAVRSDCLDVNAEQGMGHIELARWADYVLIAPASADFIAKMAHGLADDLLSTLYLATPAPTIVCPAMNRHMWAHPATQANVATLKARGVVFVGPDEGLQACGDEGFGRMAELLDILATLRLYSIHPVLKGRDVLVTAGPTREKIDPVRYISNRSSGKMGYALAQAAAIAGAKVTLISGPCALPKPLGVDLIQVTSAQEMLSQVQKQLKPQAIVIAAAAVADYTLSAPLDCKLKRTQPTLTLTLEKNPDILAAIVAQKKAAMVVGFAAETDDVLANAQAKCHAKGVDMMIANQVGEDLGFDCDENEVLVCTPDNEPVVLPRAHKLMLSGAIIQLIAQWLSAQ